jgi:hypothetical protein
MTIDKKSSEDIMGDSYRFVKKFRQSVKNVLPKVSLKATNAKTLFYSPDYKVLYDKLFSDISLDLLNTAEMVLSNFNYQTIDLVDEDSSLIYQNNNGEYEIDFTEYPSNIIGSVDSPTANFIYAINETTLSDIEDKLNVKSSEKFEQKMQYFGRGTDTGSFTKYLPFYDENGVPRYDLEMPVVDISGVIGYNIFMIQEDGTE